MADQKIDVRARSPWSNLTEREALSISPGKEMIDSTITIPGSKSLTNRALIISALADGTSKISDILKSDDSFWCIDTLKKLGIDIEVQNETVWIRGRGGKWQSNNLYIGAAGTIARFLPGVLATSGKGEWTVEASQSMSKRPVGPLVETLKELGADVSYLYHKGHYPLQIEGTDFDWWRD